MGVLIKKQQPQSTKNYVADINFLKLKSALSLKKLVINEPRTICSI